jgi:hypothetical protein
MSAPRNARPITPQRTGSFGLLANGSSGQWEVAIDETTAGSDRWFMQLDGPAISFDFEIRTVGVVSEIVRFLESSPLADSRDRDCSLVIGKSDDVPVTLVKDDEYRTRFFLVVGPPSGPSVRFVITGADAEMLIDALRQAESDLDDED